VPSEQYVDLTQPLDDRVPHGGKIPGATFEPALELERDGLRCVRMSLPTHFGTHLDAPSHFLSEGGTVDQVPLETLIGPARCLTVAGRGGEPFGVADLPAHADLVAPGDALLLRTGWDEKFHHDDYFLHPYLAPDLVDWVLERGVRLVGVDALSPDLPGPLRDESFDYPTHHRLLGAGVLIAENLDLRAVSDRACTLIIGALPVVGADGAPARVLARLEND
jgi:arylformamidase